MSHDVNLLRAKLRKSLDNVGKTNGHAMPDSTSNIDPLLHELFIASEAMAYWKTRHDAAKEKALEMAMPADELQDIIDRVTDNMQGESVIAAEGDLYTMSIDLSKPAARLDQKALRNYLRVDLSIPADDLDAAFEHAISLSAPAKRIKVMGR